MNIAVLTLRLSALACTLAPLFSQAQTAELPSGFRVGDSWEWQQVDNRTRLKEARSTRTVVSVAPAVQFFNGTESSSLAAVFVDGSYKPPRGETEPNGRPWRVWPLEVGKKWVFEANWQRQDGVTGNTKQEVTVVGIEEVTVPAGKFMAYKLEHSGYYRNSSGGSGRQLDVYWYAPEARADVKQTREDGRNSYTRELVSLQRAAP